MNSTINIAITGDVLIPDLLRKYPQMRNVLDKYGLKGCGGPEGPHEPLRVFARAHGVDVDSLIKEMRESGNSAIAEKSTKTDLADVIYRRFFVAAIAFLLTVGASWGAHILAKIGNARTFEAVTQWQIQAHGQAQVFGWMCLVIMGFAYQAFPRFWHTSLSSPGRANLSFWFMVAGIILGCFGVYSTGVTWALPVALSGATLELGASVLFACEIVATFKQSKKPMEPYVLYVMVALGWFLVSATMNVFHIWVLQMSALSASYQVLVSLVQGPMRDAQFHGLGITIILGVSLRTLPHIFGAPKPSSAFTWGALLAITVAVLMQVGGGLVRISFGMLPAALLLVVAIAAVIEFKLWRPFPDGDRSEKFIKAAWLWLVVSQTMLVMEPVYQGFSPLISMHAYQGAVRHAITVGFISLMIMGYSAKVVATLNGFDSRKLSNLVWPFLLVNIGCATRVIGQTWTDMNPAAFPIMGSSGVLETIGMVLWGFHIVKLILSRRETPTEEELRPETITASHYVGAIIDWYPDTIPVFVEFGFSAVVNPVMRKTIGRQVTADQACKMHNIDTDLFVSVLNDVIAAPAKCVGCTGTGCGAESTQAERCH